MIDLLVKFPDSKVHNIVLSDFKSVARFIKNVLGFYQYKLPDKNFLLEVSLKIKEK